MQSAAIAFAVAAAVGLMGAMLLSVAIGGAIAYFLRWPPWAGYGMPETTETMKENLAWMQNKSVQR